jgi:hypothetical protein
MTYTTIAALATDNALFRRLVAAAAQEGKSDQVEAWVSERRWQFAATPGWAEAWESAMAAGDNSPGSRNDVITDGMILAVVQPME